MASALYVFNITRQCFITLGATTVDSIWSRVRGLAGKLRMRSDEAVWVRRSRAIHTIGVPCPIDVVYLDARMRVLHIVENLAPVRIAPILLHCDSILALPVRSVYGSGTQIGDQLMICTPESMDAYWEEQRSSAGKQSATAQD